MILSQVIYLIMKFLLISAMNTRIIKSYYGTCRHVLTLQIKSIAIKLVQMEMNAHCKKKPMI